MIETHHLRAIQAIGRSGSLTTAAQELHCTQSALSHLLKELERATGVTLVKRDRRPLTLTPAGERLASCALEVLPRLATVEADLQRLRQGSSGRLLISLECHSCIEWLAPAMTAYRQRHPAIELDLRLAESFDPLPSLHAGAVDLVITSERTRAVGISGEALFRYQILAAVPARSALAGRKFLTPQDFIGASVITYPVAECRLDLYTRFLEPAGVVPGERRTAALTAMIVQWVASGLGVAALPSWAIADPSPQIVLLPLGRCGLWSDLYALRRAREAAAEHLNDFVAITRHECFRGLAGIIPIPRPALQEHPGPRARAPAR